MGPWQTSSTLCSWNGRSNSPEILTHEAESYFIAFCTHISRYVDDKINYCKFDLDWQPGPWK
jgi:hypothetical protein